MDFKNISFKFKSFDETSRVFTAYASTFGNVDLGGDIILKGAFKNAVEIAVATGKYPKLLYQHNYAKVVGKIKNMMEDENGLLIEGEFIDTTLGRDTYVEVKTGSINQMSIGYKAETYTMDEVNEIRIINDIKLYEVSFVTFPMNEEAVVTNVKTISDLKTVRDLERYFQSLGLSAKDAKGLCAKCATIYTDGREVGSEKMERDAHVDVMNSLENLNKILRSN